MSILVLSSVLFGVIGACIINESNRLVGYGMCVVCVTSILYHSTYNSIMRYIDYGSNLSLGLYFILQKNVLFTNWFVRLLWGFLAMYGNYNTSNRICEKNKFLHFIFIHIPVIIGFIYISFEKE